MDTAQLDQLADVIAVVQVSVSLDLGMSSQHAAHAPWDQAKVPGLEQDLRCGAPSVAADVSVSAAAWPHMEAQVGSKNWRPLYQGPKLTCLAWKPCAVGFSATHAKVSEGKHPRQRHSSRTRRRVCALFSASGRLFAGWYLR